MFENGEATDVVNENHKGNAPRRVSQHSSLFGCGVAVELDTQGEDSRFKRDERAAVKRTVECRKRCS